MVQDVKLLEPYIMYIMGAYLPIRMDHEALNWISTMTDAEHSIAQWRLILPVSDYDKVDRIGVKHQEAYESFRLETSAAVTTKIEDDILSLLMTKDGDLGHACYE